MDDDREKFDIKRFMAIPFGSISMLLGLSDICCELLSINQAMQDYFSNIPDFLTGFLTFFAPPLGLILGIISFILGVNAQWENGNGKATIILGIVGTVVCYFLCWYVIIIIDIADIVARG